MNDFSELEAELRKLRISPVARELATRIESALEEARAEASAPNIIRPARLQIQWLTLGVGLAAAAAFLLLARVNSPAPSARRPTFATTTPAQSNPSASAVSNTFVPTGMTQVVYNRRDEGLVFAQDANEPVRRVRSRKRETLRWQNPGTGASLEVSYPSEEVRLIPVPGQ